jgi:formylglycine-generating enzyme required for sulfatase activity
VPLPEGVYRVGEPGEEREVRVGPLRLGRWPVVNAHLAYFAEATAWPLAPAATAKAADPQLADHPATDVTAADAEAYCAWLGPVLGAVVRLPTGDEWEALARGGDGRPWPWGDVFDADRCACAEAGLGWTAPVGAHPEGASPLGAEQLAGNVWEWVAEPADGGWQMVRGGSYLDHAWGVRASRALPADPRRATGTTGFRIAVEIHPDIGRTA